MIDESSAQLDPQGGAIFPREVVGGLDRLLDPDGSGLTPQNSAQDLNSRAREESDERISIRKSIGTGALLPGGQQQQIMDAIKTPAPTKKNLFEEKEEDLFAKKLEEG